MTRRPGFIVALWVAVAVALGILSPDLTRLAAEGQAHLLGGDAESLKASEALRTAWPDQAYESLVVAALYRKEGLLAVDFSYARRLTVQIEAGSAQSGAPSPRTDLFAGDRCAVYAARTGRSRSWPFRFPRRSSHPPRMRRSRGFNRRRKMPHSTVRRDWRFVGRVML